MNQKQADAMSEIFAESRDLEFLTGMARVSKPNTTQQVASIQEMTTHLLGLIDAYTSKYTSDERILSIREFTLDTQQRY